MVADGDESDALGSIAESLFSATARRAKLFASSMSPDRTGKDIVLEERLALPDKVSFDRRPGPRICVVQVKATQSSKPKVSIKLSAAERLAKEPNAAAVLVMRLDADQECADAYLIHIQGKRLDEVLKHLRMATSRGIYDLHKAKMYFTPRRSERFEWTSAGLHEAFIRLFPSTIEEYVAAKASSVATTGFAAERYLINFTVDGTAGDLAEGFLGLKKLSVSSVEVFERRFSIDLPAQLDKFKAPAKVQITPQPSEFGALILTDADNGDQLEITCEVVLPPAHLVDLDDFRVLFRWSMGSVLMASNEWTFTPSDRSAAAYENTVADWLLHARTMDMLERRCINIKYVGEKGELSFTGNIDRERIVSTKFRPVVRMLTEVHRLLAEAGNANAPTSLQALWEQRRLVEVVGNFQDKHVKFTFQTGPTSFPALVNEKGLHIGAAQIGRTWVAIAMPMVISTEINGSEVTWTGYRSGETILEALSDGAQETFTRFREKAQKLSSTPLVFFQEPGTYLSDVTAVVMDEIEKRYRGTSLKEFTQSSS